MDEEKTKSLYLELLNNNDLDSMSEDQFMQYIANLIDFSFDLKELKGIDRAISILESLNFEKFSSEQKSLLFYFSANAWSNRFELLNRESRHSDWIWKQPDLEKVVVNLRLALNEEDFNKLDSHYKCNILTNLGNIFDTLGKFIEAIEYWDRAIEIKPDFGMALGNEGIGLINYSNYIYDPGHRGLFVRKARKNLISAIESLKEIQAYQPARLGFQRYLSQIENLIPEPKDYSCLTKNFSLGKTQAEKDYRKWCIENRLFLNPLNDLGSYSIAATDILTTPNMVTPLNVGPCYQGFFNQIKQEFSSSRFLCYEGINCSSAHFSDKDVFLYNTLDYPVYGISIEKTKIAFRITNSIFDKIAYFINEYFRLKINRKHVDFRKLWFEEIENKKEIRKKLKITKSAPLRGLYWLSRDFYIDKKDSDYLESLEPDWKDLNEIRNHLEHKYLKVHDYSYNYPVNKIDKNSIDDLAYSITRQDFERKTIRLLKLTRNAIIYLSLAINVEEKERESKSDNKSITIPFVLDKWKDDWKI